MNLLKQKLAYFRHFSIEKYIPTIHKVIDVLPVLHQSRIDLVKYSADFGGLFLKMFFVKKNALHNFFCTKVYYKSSVNSTQVFRFPCFDFIFENYQK